MFLDGLFPLPPVPAVKSSDPDPPLCPYATEYCTLEVAAVKYTSIKCAPELVGEAKAACIDEVYTAVSAFVLFVQVDVVTFEVSFTISLLLNLVNDDMFFIFCF